MATPPSRSRCCSTPARSAGPWCPSGASTGAFEAVELRDGGDRFLGKGVEQAVANVNGEIADAIVRLRRARPARHRPHPHRPRRHRQQGPPRRQRHARRLPRRGPRRRGGARPAAVPLRRWAQRPRAAGADDERAQRRRPRRQQRRLPGVHVHAGRRGQLLARRCAGAWRATTRCAGLLHDASLATALGDEGGFAPNLESNEAALQLLVEAIEPAGFTPGEQIAPGPRRGLHRVLRRRHLHASPARAARLDAGGMVDLLAGLVRPLPDRLHRGRHGRGRLGRLEAADRPRSARRVQLVGDDLFVTNTDRLARGIDAERGQRHPRQGQPDRHADRDARRRRPGHPLRPTAR